MPFRLFAPRASWGNEGHAPDHHRRIELHGDDRKRKRAASVRGRPRGGAAAGRPGHAVRRPRRRQDHLRPRADPPSRRRPGHPGAEPDLHPDADLRAAAVPGGARRPLPAGGPGGACRARLRRPAQGRGRAARMAGPGGRIPAARPHGRGVHARAPARPRASPRPGHRLRRVCAARRAHRVDPAIPRCDGIRRGRAAAHPGRCVHAQLRAARRRRPARHPDELAAPAGRAAGARRQALQRDRPSRRGHRPVRRHGERPAPASASRRRRSTRPSSRTACSSSRTWGPMAWSPAIRRRRSRSATPRRSTSCSRCTAGCCARRCRSRPTSPTICRATTWMPS